MNHYGKKKGEQRKEQHIQVVIYKKQEKIS